MSENVGVLLAWDQCANGSSLQTHAQIKTPFEEDPTLVTEVFQTWFPVLSYAFIMTHFAASSLRLLGCGRWSFSPQTSHPRKKPGTQVRSDCGLSWSLRIDKHLRWSEEKMKPLMVWEFRNISKPGLNDPNFNPGESKRCIESSTLGIGYLLLVLRLKRSLSFW